MCRIAFFSTSDEVVEQRFVQLSNNGSSELPEIKRHGGSSFILLRYSVTSQQVPHGVFPLEDDEYIFVLNGEIFGFRDETPGGFDSDTHFGLAMIEKYGLDDFLKEADFQGSFIIYRKSILTTYFGVDQLNTSGGFYATTEEGIYFAQEYAVLNDLLNTKNIPAQVPIHIVKNGYYISVKNNQIIAETAYRNYDELVWMGTNKSVAHFDKLVSLYYKGLEKSITNRMPETGKIAVMCSGGLDSSLILTLVTKIAEKQGRKKDIQVFTLGKRSMSDNDQVDIYYARKIINHLGLDEEKQWVLIEENSARREYLYRNKVFCALPRLIPGVNSRSRMPVICSDVLASIRTSFPEIKTILTGDYADEIFAGYTTMYVTAADNTEIRKRITLYLKELPLSEAARVILATMYGTQALTKEFFLKNEIEFHSNEKSLDHINLQQLNNSINFKCTTNMEKYYPIEIRHPLSSHLLLQVLTEAHESFIKGEYEGQTFVKLFLRKVALLANVPTYSALRPKVTFAQGGTGNNHEVSFPLEKQVAKESIDSETLYEFSQQHIKVLQRLRVIDTETLSIEQFEEKYEQFAVFYYNYQYAGFDRLLKGNFFKQKEAILDY